MSLWQDCRQQRLKQNKLNSNVNWKFKLYSHFAYNWSLNVFRGKVRLFLHDVKNSLIHFKINGNTGFFQEGNYHIELTQNKPHKLCRKLIREMTETDQIH